MSDEDPPGGSGGAAAAAGGAAAAAGGAAAAQKTRRAGKRHNPSTTGMSDDDDDGDHGVVGAGEQSDAEDAPTPGRRPRLHDCTPATDSKCVQYSLKKGTEVLATPAYANLVTCTRLNKMLQLDLNQKKDGGTQKKGGSSWTLDDCGRPNDSWSDNCVLLFLKNMFGVGDDESYFDWHRLRSNEFSELCPKTDPDPDFALDTVYLVDVELKPTPGGIINADDDGDNNHMALMIPELNMLYCSYYYFPNMTKADLALPENVLPYTNQLTPLIMTDQFSQDETGQITGAGVKGYRYKKVHRAYRLTLCKSPELPSAHHLKSKFDEAFGLGYGFQYRRT